MLSTAFNNTSQFSFGSYGAGRVVTSFFSKFTLLFMRDIFWTIIVIWLIYQLVSIFKKAGSKKSYAFNQNETQQNSKSNPTTITKENVKTAIKKHADKEGEYVDYEEIK